MGAAPVSMHQKTTVGFTAATDRRQAVLLGTELRGLARMSEALDAGLVILMANEFFAFASDNVAAHGGEAITTQHEMLLSISPGATRSRRPAGGVRGAGHSGDFPKLAEKWRTAYGLRSAVRRACTWAKPCSASPGRAAWSGAWPSATA